VQQAMREQVNNYLLTNVNIDLPSKLSERRPNASSAAAPSI
jgi:hypothetical protein